MAARIERAFGRLQRGQARLAEAFDRPHFGLAARDAVERGFGLFDLRLRIDALAGVERVFDQHPPDAGQFAQQGEIVNLLGKVARADQPGAAAGELREITDPADRLHRLVGFEIGLQRHRRRDAVALDQRHRLLENAAVQRLEEMIGGQRDGQILDDSVVDQNRAEKRGLSLDIARQLGGVPGGCRGGEADNI